MSDHHTEEEIAEFAEVFSFFDKDGGGAISTDELGSALRSLGHTPTDVEVEQMINDVDVNGDGELDFGEFMVLMTNMKGHDPLEELIEAFKIFDRDGDGTIKAKELMHIMSKMGDKIPLKECEEWLMDVEINEDGEIDIEKFIDFKFDFLKKA